MLALVTTCAEVTIRVSLSQVESRQPVIGVAGDVGVHHIQQHDQAHAVRRINQRLQATNSDISIEGLLGGTPYRQCEC